MSEAVYKGYVSITTDAESASRNAAGKLAEITCIDFAHSLDRLFERTTTTHLPEFSPDSDKKLQELRKFFVDSRKELNAKQLIEKRKKFQNCSKSFNDFLYDYELSLEEKFCVAKYRRQNWKQIFECTEELAENLSVKDKAERRKILDSIDECPLFKETNPVRFHAIIENLETFLCLRKVIEGAKEDYGSPGHPYVIDLNVTFSFAQTVYDNLKPIKTAIRFMDGNTADMVNLFIYGHFWVIFGHFEPF